MAVRHITGITNHDLKSSTLYDYFNQRRPLRKIEERFNFRQTRPQLSFEVEPFELLYRDKPETPKPNEQTGSRSRSYSAPVQTTRDRAKKRHKTENPVTKQRDVLYRYESHETGVDNTDRSRLTKYVWNNEMGNYCIDVELECEENDGRTEWIPVQPPEEGEDVQRDVDIATRIKSAVINSDNLLNSPRSKNRKQPSADDSDIGVFCCELSPIPVYDRKNGSISTVRFDEDSIGKYTPDVDEFDGIVPLCFNEAAQQHNVINAFSRTKHQPSENLSQTEPVVYNSHYESQPYSKSRYSDDGYKVKSILKSYTALDGTSRPMTALSICRDRDSIPTYELTYDEILLTKAPGMKQEPTSPVPSDMQHLAKVPDTIQLSKKDPQIKHKAVKRLKTPVLNMQRQCSMPSYAVLPPSHDEGGSKMPVICDRVIAPAHREWRQTKPPMYTPLYKAGYKSAATISEHGLDGDRSFVKITLPMSHIIACTKNDAKPKSAPPRMDVKRHASAGVLRRPSSQRPRTTNLTSHAEQDLNLTTTKLTSHQYNLSERETKRPLPPTKSRERIVNFPPTPTTKSQPTVPIHPTPEASSPQHLNFNMINIPTAGEEMVSVVSSANYYTDRSLGDVEEDQDDLDRQDQPPSRPPSPSTAIRNLKLQIENDLETSKVEMERFIDSIDGNRRNRKPAVTYSDDGLDDRINDMEINNNNNHFRVNTGQLADERVTQSSPILVDVPTQHGDEEDGDNFSQSLRSSMEELLAEQTEENIEFGDRFVDDVN